jgi:hypothetical protein
MQRVDLIQRSYSDDTQEYSIVIGLDKDLTFYVYSLPDFYRFYTGKDEKEAIQCFKKYTLDHKGELESF